MLKREAGRGSGANLEEEVVNEDELVLIVPIALGAANGAILEGTVSDARPKVRCLIRN